MINELHIRFLNFTFNNKSIDQSMISYFANRGSRQRINNKAIRMEYNFWFVAEGYGYVVQFKLSRCKERKIGCLLY